GWLGLSPHTRISEPDTSPVFTHPQAITKGAACGRDTSFRPIGAENEVSGIAAPPFSLNYQVLAGHFSRTLGKNEVSGQVSGSFSGILMRNACLDAALAELDAVGIRDYQLVRGGKHLQLRWTIAGHILRTIPLTATESRKPKAPPGGTFEK